MSYQVEDYVLKGADVYRIVAVEQRSLGSMPPEDYFVLDVAFPSKHKQGMSYIPVSKADMSIRHPRTEPLRSHPNASSEQTREDCKDDSFAAPRRRNYG